MGFLQKFFQNTAKQEGTFGRLISGMMNNGRTKVADWGLSHLGAFSPRVIADIGCGDGRNASKLLEQFPKAKLFGVDHEDTAVEVANETNQDAVLNGRCRIIRAEVTDLPFKDGVIDMITAFDAIYYWPGPAEAFREIRRVLSEDGVFVIVNDTDGASPDDEKRKSESDGMQILTIDELFAALKEAGFREIGMDHDAGQHNLCFLAVK